MGLTAEKKITTFFSGGSDSKESTSNAGDLGSIPGSGKSPGERDWPPIPVFLPGELCTEEAGGLQFTGLQRLGHD